MGGGIEEEEEEVEGIGFGADGKVAILVVDSAVRGVPGAELPGDSALGGVPSLGAAGDPAERGVTGAGWVLGERSSDSVSESSLSVSGVAVVRKGVSGS